MVVRSVLVAGFLGVAVLGLSASAVIVGATPPGGPAVGLAEASADPPSAADIPGAQPSPPEQQHPWDYEPPAPMSYPAEGAWEMLFRGWR
jgi:hypothetical protein